MSGMVAILGAGVIGAGWAARFALNGWHVRVYDPDPQVERNIRDVLRRARLSLPGLTDVVLPPEGDVRVAKTLEEAVAGADWIQESLPERLELKQSAYAQVQSLCRADAVIGSSTSGFTPTALQTGATRSAQILVCHPFNPVYLLPLVEVVGSDANPPEILRRACDVITGLGMYPLHIRQEIEAHVADRLLEAVWREALWLVKDGVATTEEIDNAIRYGFGLRWAQMGLFETYRIAGGEAGMTHFLAQFGPALKWPWSKLTDVPDLDEALISRIAAQSDAQSGAHSTSALEEIRDRNLVAMMRALKAQDHGAGQLLNAHDRVLQDAAGLPDAAQCAVSPEPCVETARRTVPLDWADYNGHMTEARYLHAFADATDRFMELIGCDADYIARGGSFFTAETHIRHLDEVLVGAPISILTRALSGGGKKMHLWHEMRVGARLVATGEHFLLHVSLETRRACDAHPSVDQALRRFVDAQKALPWPEGAGRAIAAARTT